MDEQPICALHRIFFTKRGEDCALCGTARRAGEGSQAAPQPFGYAYRYADGIRFDTGGREINGSMPIEVIPLYRAAAAVSGTFAAQRDLIAKWRSVSEEGKGIGSKGAFAHEVQSQCADELEAELLAQEKREPAPTPDKEQK